MTEWLNNRGQREKEEDVKMAGLVVRFPSWTSWNHTECYTSTKEASSSGGVQPPEVHATVNTQQSIAQSHLCTLKQGMYVFLLNWFPFLPGKLSHIHQPFLYLGLAIQQFCASPMVLLVKKQPINAGVVRDVGSIPGSERTPGGGHGNPVQYSCLENPMDRGTWRATVLGVAKSQTQLNN